MRIIGHGVDIVEVARVARMLEEHGERFAERVFAAAERVYADAVTAPRREERYAARFAAKEAAMKALGVGWTRGVGWTDIAVDHDPDGRPRLMVSGAFADLARSRGVTTWWLSLSHTGGYAVASVIAAADDAAPQPNAFL